MNYFEDFEKTELTETKKMKASLSLLPGGEGCKYLCGVESVVSIFVGRKENNKILQGSFEMKT